MPEDLHSRLAGMVIACLDRADFIACYDSANTLFYLDPPCWGCEDDYGKAMFSRDDFRRLADWLAGLRGRFLLSLNDVPETRDVFTGFHMTGARIASCLNASRSGRTGTRTGLPPSNHPPAAIPDRPPCPPKAPAPCPKLRGK